MTPSPQSSWHRKTFGQLLIATGFLFLVWLGFRYAYSYVDQMIDRQPDRFHVNSSQEQPANKLKSVEPGEEPKELAAMPPAVNAPVQPSLPPKPVHQPIPLANERVILRTIGGDIVLAFYPEAAPKTVEQIVKLMRAGVFDTTHFARLEPGFVLQTSVAQDRMVPLLDQQRAMIHPIPGEFSKTIKHRRGVISMGRDDGKPDSAETSFSILLNDAPHLDGQYTIFGFVETGMDVVDRMVQTQREADSNRPAHRLTILRADVVSEDFVSNVHLEKPREMQLIENQIFAPSTLASRSLAILQQHCWRCHGEGSTKGQLDLTTHNGFLKGGEHGPVFLPKDANSSMLLKRLHAQDDTRMPPKGPALHLEEIKTLTLWMNQGAPFPLGIGQRKTAQSRMPLSPQMLSHWAWQPLKGLKPPVVKNAEWCNNDIDRFILARLEAKGLASAPPATSQQLHRRLSYGLTGLPPEASAATMKHDVLVDHLLKSDHYGEQMARFWLDLVRYADSDGYEDDKNRPLAYSYRDFVIRAFNQDLPFDKFVQWQIAGDEITPDSAEARAATGFLAAGPYQTFFPKKKDRYDELDDIVSTAGVSFIGMTVGCARCHDHKHDPISQHDYYRLVSVFHGSKRQENYLDVDAGNKYETLRGPADQLKKELEQLRIPAREVVRNEKIDSLPIKPHEKESLRQPIDSNNDLQAGLLRRYEHLIQVADDEARNARNDNVADQWDNLEARIADEERRLPARPSKGLIYSGSHISASPFLERGDVLHEREIVQPGFVTALTRGRPLWRSDTWKAWGETSRKAYANWLTDVDAGAGQLTARVIVNRLWQMHFGTGLVRTANDFGMHGEPPSHPELLDWLAKDFIASGWKVKRLHRMIVMSKTYQLSSQPSHELTKADPENRLFGRYSPYRLSAESLRDSILAVSGNLNREMYGPGIMPAIPKEAIFQTAPKHGVVWPEEAPESPENWRRSVYIYSKRSNPVPMLQLFDSPDTSASCARRSQSTVPTQALALLNDPFIRKQATMLAEKLMKESKDNALQATQQAYRAILGRECTTQEIALMSQLHGKTAREGEAPAELRITQQTYELQQLIDVCHVLMMTNEFLYVN